MPGHAKNVATLALLFVGVVALRGVVGTAGLHGSAEVVPCEFDFGFEQGHIAGNLARGLGYCVKFGDAPPIPTAWASPLYPLMLAGLFRVCGAYTFDAALAVIWLNAAFHGGIAVLLWLIGRRLSKCGDPAISWLAVAMFVIMPAGWQFLHWAWCIHLLAMLIMMHLYVLMREFRSPAAQAAWAGATLGLAMLTDAAAVMIVPVSAWCLIRRYRGVRILRPAAGFCLAWLVIVSPWAVRNGVALGSWSPLRGMLGTALWMGNHPGAAQEDYHGLRENPWHNPTAAARFVALGERGFDADCKSRFLDLLAADPQRFVHDTAMRTTGFWLNEWWIGWRGYPWNLNLGTILSTVLAFAGVCVARRRGYAVGPLMAVLVLFPIPYYITFLSYGRYRFPIEPLMCLLAGIALHAVSIRAIGRHGAE